MPEDRVTSEAMRSKAELGAAINGGGPAVLLINTRARRGDAVADQAVRLLTRAGFALADVIRVTEAARLAESLDRAIDARPDLLIVGGGDGTLSAAGRRLAHLDMALGVLPIGTTNNFARSLGLPPDLKAAITTLAKGKVVDIDLGRAGGDVFANMVSVGVSVKVAGQVPDEWKRVLGRAAYPLTALRALPGHRPFRARVLASGTEMEFETHQLNIANGAFHGGQRIARDASIDDRLLVAYRLGTDNRLRLITATIRHAATGQWRSMSDDGFLTTGELLLETDPVLPLDVDGEIRGTTPVPVRIDPNALRVLAPMTFVDR